MAKENININTEGLTNLIDFYHKQLKNSYSILDFIEEANDILNPLELEYDSSTSKSNIKYYCFLTTSQLDLFTILKGYLNADTKWEKIYYSRMSFLTIYETIQTYHTYQLSVNEYLEENHPALKTQYKEINKILKEFKKQYDYDNKISSIRNKTAGHFHKEFSEFYIQIKNIENELSTEAIETFLIFLKILLHFVYRMADEAAEQTSSELKGVNGKILEKMAILNNIILKK